jgi:hypothetical protein
MSAFESNCQVIWLLIFPSMQEYVRGDSVAPLSKLRIFPRSGILCVAYNLRVRLFDGGRPRAACEQLFLVGV